MSIVVITMTLQMDNMAMIGIVGKDRLVGNFHMMKVILIN
jgi:hypothetical protein